jgi:hypothetical protein
MAAMGLLVLGGGVATVPFRHDLASLLRRLLFAGRGRGRDKRILIGMNVAVGVALIGIGLVFLLGGVASGRVAGITPETESLDLHNKRPRWPRAWPRDAGHATRPYMA